MKTQSLDWCTINIAVILIATWHQISKDNMKAGSIYICFSFWKLVLWGKWKEILFQAAAATIRAANVLTQVLPTMTPLGETLAVFSSGKTLNAGI